MTNVLDEICNVKKQHIATQKAQVSEQNLLREIATLPETKGFYHALAEKAARKETALITEVKKASPSKGVIRADFDPVAIAKTYEKAGAACISVLTDEPYFQGKDSYLQQVRRAVGLPLLRKDFMLEPYQIIESRALGADAVLLIMAALEDAQAAELEAAAHGLGMDVLIEVHNAEELTRALTLKSPLIGINNRNLKTLEVSLSVTEALVKHVPPTRLIICESGIGTHADIERIQKSGTYCFLVGESLMRQQDIAAAIDTLCGKAGSL